MKLVSEALSLDDYDEAVELSLAAILFALPDLALEPPTEMVPGRR